MARKNKWWVDWLASIGKGAAKGAVEKVTDEDIVKNSASKLFGQFVKKNLVWFIVIPGGFIILLAAAIYFSVKSGTKRR